MWSTSLWVLLIECLLLLRSLGNRRKFLSDTVIISCDEIFNTSECPPEGHKSEFLDQGSVYTGWEGISVVSFQTRPPLGWQHMKDLPRRGSRALYATYVDIQIQLHLLMTPPVKSSYVI